MKKTVSLLLAVLLCFGMTALVACKGGDGSGDTTAAQATSDPNGSDPSGGVDQSTVLEVPENLDFNNETFTILGYNSTIGEVYDDTVPETDNDTVNNALYLRDRDVQDYLNVGFRYQSINGQFNDRVTYAQTVSNSVLSGYGAYDLVGAYSLVPPALAMNKNLLNLNELPHIDFDKVWWPSFMSDVCTVNGITYFMSGDISTNLLYNMQGVLIDIEKMVAAGITEEMVFDLVDSGNWTLETFFELASGLSSDSGDGIWDEKDFYAIHIQDKPLLDSFYFASGLRLLDNAENGLLQISKDITDDRTLDIYSLVYEEMYGDQPVAVGHNLMKERQCVFNLGTVYTLRNLMTGVANKFGIMPFPKYLKTDDYRTLIGSPHTQYCVPLDVKNQERSAAVMEMLAYSAYKHVTPVVYENVMKLRYSTNDNYSRMFDVMRAGATTDLGILYYTSFKRDPQSLFRNAIDKKVTGWVSNYRNNYSSDMESVVVKINEIYQR